MSFSEYMAKDRRLALLRFLDDAPERKLNIAVIQTALDGVAHSVSRDIIETDMELLEEHGFVRIERLPLRSGELLIGHLTEAGCDAANGRRRSPVVARPKPR